MLRGTPPSPTSRACRVDRRAEATTITNYREVLTCRGGPRHPLPSQSRDRSPAGDPPRQNTHHQDDYTTSPRANRSDGNQRRQRERTHLRPAACGLRWPQLRNAQSRINRRQPEQIGKDPRSASTTRQPRRKRPKQFHAPRHNGRRPNEKTRPNPRYGKRLRLREAHRPNTRQTSDAQGVRTHLAKPQRPQTDAHRTYGAHSCQPPRGIHKHGHSLR